MPNNFCACYMDVHCEPPDVHKVTIVQARRLWHCVECHERILPGEPYEFVRGLWEGVWMTYRTCLTCKRIREDLFCNWVYGELSNGLSECLGIGLLEVPVET